MSRTVPHLALTPTDQAIYITADDRDTAVGGNMSHVYHIDSVDPAAGMPRLGEIRFQRGPVKEVGVNGVTNEALIAICIDRLEGAQEGPFASEDNSTAIEALKSASEALAKRTRDRMARGVEGQSKA